MAISEERRDPREQSIREDLLDDPFVACLIMATPVRDDA